MKESFSWSKAIAGLMLVSLVLHALPAALLEWGNDEVYYQTYAQHLQANYFDHPPVVAWLIKPFAAASGPGREFLSRIPALLLLAGDLLLAFAIVRKWDGPRSAWFAAGLVAASLYAGVIAGTFILPDTPELFFWLLALYFAVDIAKKERPGRAWIGFGIAAGLAVMSKVSGVFLWAGLFGWVLFSRRSLLRDPLGWLAFALTAAIASPIFFWNIANDFITYRFHSARVGFFGRHFDADGFFQHLGGLIFYNNPVNIALLAAMGFAWMRKRVRLPEGAGLFAWMSCPLILVVLLASLFNDMLPHWTGPAVTTLLLPAGAYLSRVSAADVFPRWLKAAWIVAGLVTLGGLAVIGHPPAGLGARSPEKRGDGDISLDLTGWRKFAIAFDSLYRADLDAGRMKPGATLLSDKWFPGGHIDEYLALPFGRRFIAAGALDDIHHFAWTNRRAGFLPDHGDAYFIAPTNYFRAPDASLRACFAGTSDSLRIAQTRGGDTARFFVIYRLRDADSARLRALYDYPVR